MIQIILILNFISGERFLNESIIWENNLTGIFHSSLISGDIDSDGDFDLITMGCTAGEVDTCTTADKIRVYVNNGTTFNEDLIWESNTTEGLGYGSLALGDIDNDGDLDLVALGDVGRGIGDIQIYINNGTTLIENSTWESNLSHVDAYAGSLAFGDVDLDGDLDLALVGASPSGDNGIYINNGTSFTISPNWLISPQLVGHGSGYGALAFGDLNNDGNLDLVFAGSYGTNFYTSIYINNQTSLNENSSWKGDFTATFGWPSLTLGDHNNDGYIDLIAIGTRVGDHIKIYNNTGSKFSLQQSEGIIAGLFSGDIMWGDYDIDGDLDFIANGREGATYVGNNTNSLFSDPADEADGLLDLETGSSVLWIDLENDTDLDFVEFGNDNGGIVQAKVYTNNRSLTRNNTKPNPPLTGFSTSYVNNVLKFGWFNASDAETNSSGLYYNLMVGNSTANHTIVSGIYGGSSNPTAGYFGNMMQRKNITLNVVLEANKDYYWYVQTIDTGLQKSNWSAVQTFSTGSDVDKPDINLTAPSPADNAYLENPYISFNASVGDANLANVTLYANWTGSMIANQTNVSAGVGGAYNFSKNLTWVSDGWYGWHIKACDSASNCKDSAGRSFLIDRVSPYVFSVSPDAGSTWTSSSTVTFTYNVTDTDIANCSLIINGAIDQTDTSVDEETSQTFSKSLSNADYTWSVNCTDYLNRINSSVARSLTVSYSAPGGGNGGGGGGGGTTTVKVTTAVVAPVEYWTHTYVISEEEFKQEEGISRSLGKKERLEVKIENKTQYIGVVGIKEEEATIEIAVQTFVFKVSEKKKFDTNNDNYYDLGVVLEDIADGKAELKLLSIYEEVPVKELEAEKGEAWVLNLIKEIWSRFGYWIIGVVIILALLSTLIKIKLRKKRIEKIESEFEKLREKAVKKIDMKTFMEKIRKVKEK